MSFLDLLEKRAADYESQVLFRFLTLSGEETSLTFGEVHARARHIAGCLQDAGAGGQPVLLLFPPGGPDFIVAFLGCLLAGSLAAPVYPPERRRLDRALPRLRAVVHTSGAVAVLTDETLHELSGPAAAAIPELGELPWWTTAELADRSPSPWSRPEVTLDSIALLQFTSGSTSFPKGVMVSHGNLLANLEQQAVAAELGNEMRGVCWLPYYHDLGLISGVFLPIYLAGETTFVAPLDFVRRPLLWLQAIARYRANLAGGPDFGYALCVRRTRPEDRATLDLSSWHVAFIGAEPVRVSTLEQFTEAFATAGFRPETFAPGYGLAEATVLVAITEPKREPVVGHFARVALETGTAVAADPSEPGVIPLVSCGPPAQGMDIRIVNPERQTPLPEDHVGEIWLAGDNVAQGYWNSEDTITFGRRLPGEDAPFVRTGDLGFLHDGELFVTGREKDLIIIRGRNHVPADIEVTAESAHAMVRPGGCAAFSVEIDDAEQVVVMAEATGARGVEDADELAAVVDAVSRAVQECHGIAPRELVMILPWTMPRTSSGKIQRHAARAAYLDGTLTVVTRLSRASGRVWSDPSGGPDGADGS